MSKNFTFICGEDDFLVSVEGKKAFETMTVELMDDLSREVIDGNAGKADEVVQTVVRFIAA
ncbi:MAG: DNA polymerase III subunit delta, partial [Opitutales bacterium]|nr:DNA polymerase III subunit delta [Opitutales bacterium]